jgi:hypothetical protein
VLLSPKEKKEPREKTKLNGINLIIEKIGFNTDVPQF